MNRRVTSPSPGRRLFGSSTDQAIAAFPISGLPMPQRFLAALVIIKLCAARANQELGLLSAEKARAIVAACEDILAGGLWDQFPVDIYQTGSGTSSNMNCNEVIAAMSNAKHSRAGTLVHPNDDVNKCQSSNDVVPTAVQLASVMCLKEEFLPALYELHRALKDKSDQFWPVLKLGRTHLQDALPVRLGQEMLGYAGQIEGCVRLAGRAIDELCSVPLGGTAVGTGLNSHPSFARLACSLISERVRMQIVEEPNHFKAQSTLDTLLSAHGELKTIALSLWKIGSDLRLMASGPRSGFHEIVLPDAGVRSSIMPAKSPPAVIESLLMVVARVVGNDSVLTFAQTGSLLELNVMMPVAAAAMIESIELLSAATYNFSRRCVTGVEATPQGPQDAQRCAMLATALVPTVGYDAASRIANEALANDVAVFDVALHYGVTREQAETLLDPVTLVEPAAQPAPRQRRLRRKGTTRETS